MEYVKVFVFFMTFTFVTPAAGTECYTVFTEQLVTVDCDAMNKRQVPLALRSNVQHLILNNNLLTSLESRAFQGYRALQVVEVEENDISRVASDAFDDLENLRELHLCGNLLQDIPSASFEDTPRLRTINLAKNHIRRVEANAFLAIPDVEEIDLESNVIDFVATGAFASLRRLLEIDLAGNQLTTLDAAMQLQLPVSIQVLRLYNNPWHCDCHLRRLRQ